MRAILLLFLVFFAVFMTAESITIEDESDSPLPHPPTTPSHRQTPDACGVLGGDGTSCLGCDGKLYPGQEPPTFDACGKCGGDGKSCCGPAGACSGHGVCSGEVRGCECDYGFTGPFCQKAKEPCQHAHCGEHGTCDPETGKCVCEDGWFGQMCSIMDCGENGWYNRATGTCKCLTGYTGPDCNECGGAPEGEMYLCMGTVEKFELVSFNEKQGRVYEKLTALGKTFFEPGTNPEYGCDCKHVDAVNTRSAARFSLKELTCEQILDAFNDISIENIDQQDTTPKQLGEIVDKNNRDRTKRTSEALLPVAGAGVLIVMLLFILVIVAAIYMVIKGNVRKND